MTFHVRPRLRLAIPLLLSVGLAVSGCSDSGDSPGEEPTERTTVGGEEILGRWPLTGLPADQPAPDRPVMVVKVDNTASGAPQVGLSQADLVVEELVEGGETRLAVMYYQRVPPLVGPVRSMRATDIGIVKPVDASIVASGAAGPTTKRLSQANVRTFVEGAKGFERAGDRSAPYNLMMRLPELLRSIKGKSEVPAPYLPWGEGEALAGQAKPAPTISATFSPRHTSSWRFVKGAYERQGSLAAQGDDFRPATVLVLRVRVGDAGYRDPAGNPVPETILSGRGEAWLFNGGKVVRGTWSKSSLDSPLTLRSGAGELTVPPGHTWIELVPREGGEVTFGR